MHIRWFFAVLVLLASSLTLQAAEYNVQIGSLKRPHDDFAVAASEVGSVYTSQSPNGYTRYHVGSYTSKTQAQAALVKLQRSYPDAFIRSGSGEVASYVNTSSAGPADHIPPELSDRVVYLDGVLHVKEGETFTPLSQYPL